MTLTNATGKRPDCPACPRCKGALKPEPRYGLGGKLVTGFWHCDHCNRVFVEDSPSTTL